MGKKKKPSQNGVLKKLPKDERPEVTVVLEVEQMSDEHVDCNVKLVAAECQKK